jgi:putative endonuclease
MKEYFVYIMTNKSRTLYTGVTGNIEGRVYQHKHGQGSTFTSKYNIDQLVYYETFSNILDALTREKQIKGRLRVKKIASIESMNPGREDLSADWY